jgi:hypothetical protein
MDDAVLMRRGEPFQELQRVVEHRAQRECPLLTQPFSQRLALEQLGDDVGDAVFLADVVDRQHIGMIERTRRPGFGFEPTESVWHSIGMCRQHLDGDGSFQPGIAGTVDRPHAAGADEGDDLVWPEPGPWGDGHGGGLYGRGPAHSPESRHRPIPRSCHSCCTALKSRRNSPLWNRNRTKSSASTRPASESLG